MPLRHLAEAEEKSGGGGFGEGVGAGAGFFDGEGEPDDEAFDVLEGFGDVGVGAGGVEEAVGVTGHAVGGEKDDGGRGVEVELFDLAGEFETVDGFAVEGGVGEGDVHEDQIDMGAGDVEDGVAVFLEDAVDAAGEFEDVGEDEFISGIIFDGEYAIALHSLTPLEGHPVEAPSLDSNADRRREVPNS